MISKLFSSIMSSESATISSIPRSLHTKCRDTTKPYLRTNIYRCLVPEEQVPWDVPFDGYKPIDYTSESVKGKPWADSSDPRLCKFNSNDSGIIRTSFHGEYAIDEDGRPLNPFGRTGLRGRGNYGKWGPNHAGDAIVSRFVGQQLQFVAIERRDTGEMAIPGGMLDRGESSLQAVIREFREEVLENRHYEKLANFWESGKTVYTGYVDDPRNTDNAWAETTAVNFHDSVGLFDDINLKGGDDAKSAQWVTVKRGLKLYASHQHLICLFAKMHGLDFDP